MISFTALYEMRCQEIICDGDGWLDAEEQANPAYCALCGKRMCDACAFGVQIPYDVLGEPPNDWLAHYKRCQARNGHAMCPHSQPTEGQRYECLVCSDCFKEEWV